MILHNKQSNCAMNYKLLVAMTTNIIAKELHVSNKHVDKQILICRVNDSLHYHIEQGSFIAGGQGLWVGERFKRSLLQYYGNNIIVDLSFVK